jgi:membrane protein implicated in regulation of membrane protease activity
MSGRAPGVFWTYLLLQAPDIVLAGLILFVLHRWAGLPTAWAVGALVVWIAKDIAMYPVVRSVFGPSRTGPEAFIGARGVVADTLAPLGYVSLNGELWRAESLRPRQSVPVGAPVVVRSVQGLTFLVEPEPSGADGPDQDVSRGGQPNGLDPARR